MTEREIKSEYENILLRKKKNYSSSLFNSSDENNEKTALVIMRYAFESFLQWTPQDIKNCINWEILQTMKLDTLIKHIKFPGELTPRTDLDYIAHLLYPNIIHFDSKEKTLRIYKNVLSKKVYRYPREFWEGPEGEARARFCLRYMLQNCMVFHNVEEIYKAFSGREGIKILKDYQLYVPCELIFGSPVDYLHVTLSQSQKDEFLYHYYKFKQQLSSAS